MGVPPGCCWSTTLSTQLCCVRLPIFICHRHVPSATPLSTINFQCHSVIDCGGPRADVFEWIMAITSNKEAPHKDVWRTDPIQIPNTTPPPHPLTVISTPNRTNKDPIAFLVARNPFTNPSSPTTVAHLGPTTGYRIQSHMRDFLFCERQMLGNEPGQKRIRVKLDHKSRQPAQTRKSVAGILAHQASTPNLERTLTTTPPNHTIMATMRPACVEAQRPTNNII